MILAILKASSFGKYVFESLPEFRHRLFHVSEKSNKSGDFSHGEVVNIAKN